MQEKNPSSFELACTFPFGLLVDVGNPLGNCFNMSSKLHLPTALRRFTEGTGELPLGYCRKQQHSCDPGGRLGASCTEKRAKNLVASLKASGFIAEVVFGLWEPAQYSGSGI